GARTTTPRRSPASAPDVFESGVVGLIQGVTELFPVSSLGHNVLLPALVGGCWGRDLNVATAESPYLAYIVGLHVATAIALLIYFRRDWVRIIGGFFTSLGHIARPEPGTRRWQLRSVNEKLAWMIILATIPGGAGRGEVRARVPGLLRQAMPVV